MGIGAADDPDKMVKVAGDDDSVIAAPVNKDSVELTKLLMKKLFNSGEHFLISLARR